MKSDTKFNMGDYVSFQGKKWKVISEPIKNDNVYEYDIESPDGEVGLVSEGQITEWKDGGKHRRRRTNKKSSRRRRRTSRR
jgi:hypothetical protein